MISQKRFEKVWKDLHYGRAPKISGAKIFKDIRARYAEPHRVYHAESHLEAGLKEFDSCTDKFALPLEAEMAWYFHYAVCAPVYDFSMIGQNEKASAELVEEKATNSGIHEARIYFMKNFIMETQMFVEPSNSDRSYLIDVDYSILGRPSEVFAQYEKDVRQEYKDMPEALFRERRGMFLNRILSRHNIFWNGLFKGKYEAQARRNLEGSLKRLNDGVE